MRQRALPAAAWLLTALPCVGTGCLALPGTAAPCSRLRAVSTGSWNSRHWGAGFSSVLLGRLRGGARRPGGALSDDAPPYHDIRLGAAAMPSSAGSEASGSTSETESMLVELSQPSRDYDSEETQSEKDTESEVGDPAAGHESYGGDEEPAGPRKPPADWRKAAIRSQTEWQTSLSQCVVPQPRPYRDGLPSCSRQSPFTLPPLSVYMSHHSMQSYMHPQILSPSFHIGRPFALENRAQQSHGML